MTNDAARDAALREEGRVQERARVVAWLRRWVEVRPSIAGYFADQFEAGAHLTHQPDASQGSAPVAGLVSAMAKLLEAQMLDCTRCAELEGYCGGCYEAHALLEQVRALPAPPAAPQGSPLPGGGPRVDEVVEVFTEGKWRPAKVNAVYPDADAFGWTVLPAGLPDGGSIGGATSVGNAAWRRNPPEGGALEGERLRTLEEERGPIGDEPPVKRYAVYLCDLCVQGTGGECHSPGCSLWMKRAPGVPLISPALMAAWGGDPMCVPLDRTSVVALAVALENTPENVEAFAREMWKACEAVEWNDASDEDKAVYIADASETLDIVHRLAAPAPGHPVPAIPQSGDEKEGTDG